MAFKLIHHILGTEALRIDPGLGDMIFGFPMFELTINYYDIT